MPPLQLFPYVPLTLAAVIVVLAGVVVWLNRQLHQAREQGGRLRGELATTAKALEKAHHELKSLTGLLPMCAWCKKIRDDEGYWQQLEGYITSHTDVEFSHSMCPECTQKIEADMPDAKWRI